MGMTVAVCLAGLYARWVRAALVSASARSAAQERLQALEDEVEAWRSGARAKAGRACYLLQTSAPQGARSKEHPMNPVLADIYSTVIPSMPFIIAAYALEAVLLIYVFVSSAAEEGREADRRA